MPVFKGNNRLGGGLVESMTVPVCSSNGLTVSAIEFNFYIIAHGVKFLVGCGGVDSREARSKVGRSAM
jgi:hypothetical protein